MSNAPHAPHAVTAIVLAAGRSQRMGRPKLLLPWGDTTILGQTLRQLQQAPVTETVVVVGYYAAATTAIALAHHGRALFNPHYAAGDMLSSLQLGMRQLAATVEAALVVLADQPLLAPETVAALLAAWAAGRGRLIAPVYAGQAGHPVLIGRQHFAALLELPAGGRPRDLFRQYPQAVYHLPVDTPTILLDIDTPEAYTRWRPPPAHGESRNNLLSDSGSL